MLMNLGVQNIIACDREGILARGEKHSNLEKEALAEITNPENMTGRLQDAMSGADVFIGVSAAGVVSEDMVRSMANDAIVFAMANPTPEIMPDLAIKAGARIVGTGRSDFPNQINNVLAFPGIFRGALDVRATDISEAMKVAAVYAIAAIVQPDELKEGYVIPDALDLRVGKLVAEAVAKSAVDTGISRI
jgi:malate dehydrogenase (oxaloacetate-decarboxylating)